MDPKATARSKRNYSSQRRRRQPLPESVVALKKKPAESNSAAAAAGGGGGANHAPRRPQSRELPSNWSRYDDEEEAVGSSGTEKTCDVAPKSKGADFALLVEQARAKLHNGGSQQPSFSPLEKLPFDFMQGMSSMLSTRGESLLSWCEDDNFIVDDEITSSFEVPFLPLDLKALAGKLLKLKKSERLFVEAELFPEEQVVESNQKVSEELDSMKKNEVKDVASSSTISNASNTEKNADNANVNVADGAYKKEVQLNKSSMVRGVSTAPLNILKDGEFGGRTQGPISQIKSCDSNTTGSCMVKEAVAAAAAELDMLLDTLGETGLSSTNATSYMGISIPLDTTPLASSSCTTLDPHCVKELTSSSLDDDVDRLLGETYSCLGDEKHKSFMQKEAPVFSTSVPLHPPIYLKHDDIDSWLDTL